LARGRRGRRRLRLAHILLERINHAAMTASVELTTLFRITSRCT